MVWNIGWGLTAACNSRCIHCYNASGKKSSDEITFEEARLLVDKLAENNVVSINYGTGESGLVDYFWDLVHYVNEKNILQGLTTNGSSVNENTIGYIKKYINDVDVSIDYPNKDEHNTFRGSPNAWDWAMNACDLLRKNGVNFSIVTCLHALNSSKKHIDEFLEFCKGYGGEWRINWFKPTGRGKVNEMLKLDPLQVHSIFQYIVENSIITALPDPYFSALLGLNSRTGSPCGTDSFRITPSTEVVPCVYFTKEMKNISIRQHSFDEVVTSDAMKKVQNRDLTFCKGCEYFPHCQGGCVSRAYLEYHDINAPDSFCFRKIGLKENPLKSLKFEYDHSTVKVHENYLCTVIVKPKS